jgi:hypothetical protein
MGPRLNRLSAFVIRLAITAAFHHFLLSLAQTVDPLGSGLLGLSNRI